MKGEAKPSSRIPKPSPTWLPASAAQAITPVPDSKLRWPGWGSVSPKLGRQQQAAPIQLEDKTSPKTFHTTMTGVPPNTELIKAAWRNSSTPTLTSLPHQSLQPRAVAAAPPSGLHSYTTGNEVVQSAAAFCSAAAQLPPELLTSQQPRLIQLKTGASQSDVQVDVNHATWAEDDACAASHLKQHLQRKSWGMTVDEDGKTPENWLCPLPLPQSQVEAPNPHDRCSISEELRPAQSILQRCSINGSVYSTGYPSLEKLTLLEQQAHLEGCLGRELSQSGYELDHEGALQQLEVLSAELERLRTPVRASKPSNLVNGETSVAACSQVGKGLVLERDCESLSCER